MPCRAAGGRDPGDVGARPRHRDADAQPARSRDVKMLRGVIRFHARSEHPARFPALQERPLTCNTTKSHMSPRLPLAGLFICSLAAAQTVSFGVVGGASLTPDFESRFSAGAPPGPPIVLTDYSAPERYIAGGMLELQLPKDWSIEVDALFHPLRFDENHYANGTLHNFQPLPVVTWEFPALAKYRFRWRSWRPFLEAGPSFRTAGNLNGTNPSHYGIAVGAGAETRLGRFRIAPEVRYIRWAENTSSEPLSRPDQVELLTSLSTGTFEGSRRAFGTRVSVGVVAGATVTPDLRTSSQPFPFTGSFSSNPAAFLLGAMVEVEVARGVFIEGDAIHQPITVTFRGAEIQSIDTWSFPLVGKYKFSTHGMKPFLEAGPAFRGAKALIGSSPYGVTAGAGIETHLWRMAIAPSVRYTHWGPISGSSYSFVPFQNQVAVLAGFSF